MNLFYLDEDLDKCAEYHVDNHVNKMILEAAQLLCTVAVAPNPPPPTMDTRGEDL